MTFFRKILLIILGERDYSISDNRALRISTIMFIEAVFIAIIYIPFHVSLGGWELAKVSWIVGLAALLSLVLVKLNFTILARLSFITLANFGIYINSQWAGLESCIHYFFGVSISLPFFMFATSKHKMQIIYSILMSLIFGMATQFESLSLFDKLVLNYDFIIYYKSISTLAALIMLAYTTFYFHSFVEANEKEIEAKNQLIFQSEKMVSLGILSSGIAHEINNPLTVLKIGLNQIQKQCSEMGQAKLETLDKIIKMSQNVDRIAKIVQALKTYSRNEAKDPLQLVKVDFILDEALSLLTKEFSSNEVEFIKDTNFSDVLILVREGELIQVFVNILKNSIDAIKNSSNKKWVKVFYTKTNENLQVHFVDSGEGISSDNLEKIFEPFYSTKGVGEGTGLGLFICLNLLQSMGGKLEYQLYDGHTSFTVSLKIASK